MRTIRLTFAMAAIATLVGAASAVPFPQVDRDRDGLVSYQDVRPKMRQLSEVHFRKCDYNGDGLLDYQEFLVLSNMYNALYRSPN
jgi:hypothetical protein